ncbi:hypothetical protein [Maridesulfovibrio sp.]|uniref:hypothetical protein n=1 Tax=Maridesulfovibrio sp. TaxID=2795000 RepID=UPI0039F108FE
MVKQHRNNLFNDCELSVILQNIYDSILTQIENIPAKDFLEASDEDLLQKIIKQNTISQIKLHEDEIRICKPALCRITESGRLYTGKKDQDHNDFKDGMITRVEIPYSGDKRLLISRPSMNYAYGGPSFTIKDDRLIKHYVRPLYSDPNAFKKHFLRNYERIQEYLKWQAKDIALFEKKLNKLIYDTILQRRKRDGTTSLHLASRAGTTEFNPVHVKNNITIPYTHKYSDHTPIISDTDFINAIRVIRHTGNSFERTPSIYGIHNDQDLRNILVSNLNTHFADTNNQDLFFAKGTVDFSITIGDKSALCGKCFSWYCPEGLIYHVNQLLDKAHWPSSKIVIAIFNRSESDFSTLANTVHSAFTSHDCYIETNKQFSDFEWQTTMHTLGDIKLKHWVHFMLFNLFVRKNEHTVFLNEAERNFFLKN